MEIFVSKSKIVKAILLGMIMTFAALFVAVKVFYIIFPADRSVLTSSFDIQIIPLFVGIVSIIGFFMFGAMTIIFTSRLFYNEPQVIINLEGIEDKRLGTGFIEWKEIGFFWWNETQYASWLTINFIFAGKVFQQNCPVFKCFCEKANGQKGNNDLRIRFTDLDTPIGEAWDFIEKNVIKPREAEDLALKP